MDPNRPCPACARLVEPRFRFCPWCAAPLRSKLVELFHAHPDVDTEEPPRALRVSRYLGPTAEERHVRFSVWRDDGRVLAAVSVDDAEAERLARFLQDSAPPAAPVARRRVRDRLHALLGR